MRKTILILSCLLVVAGDILAGGYQVRLQGSRQNGMGLTGTALNSGASNIFYNPGGLGFYQKRFDFTLGASAVMSKISYQSLESDYSAKTDNPVSPPFFFYGMAKITDKLVAGLGVYTPYGSRTEWPSDWKGKNLIQSIGLRAYYIQPTLSYMVTDNLGIGAGFVFVTGKVEIDKALNYNGTSSANLSGTTSAMGFNVGVTYKPISELTIGLNYRSKVAMELTGGDATFNLPQSVTALVPANNKFDATLPLPANLDFGVAWQVNNKLLLTAELNYVFWGTYDTLSFSFETAGSMLNSDNPRLYSDRIIPRVGAEYVVNDKLTVRAGAYYDATPTNEDYFNPETVSLNTVAFTLGLSYKPINNLTIDLSYLQLHGLESERYYKPANFGGKYKTFTMVPGIGINYSF
ncbi:MAG: outer membrane protein transport protein [Sphingobacteriia bacterium]|nr:outer membrane protein transport protein [Sphingobacteriia bacterium]